MGFIETHFLIVATLIGNAPITAVMADANDLKVEAEGIRSCFKGGVVHFGPHETALDDIEDVKCELQPPAKR